MEPSRAAAVTEAAIRIAALRETFSSGRTRSLEWRLDQLAALDELVRSEERRLLEALSADIGRIEHEAFLSDVYAVRAGVQALARGVPRWSRSRRVRTPLPLWPAHSTVRFEPLGVVLVIGTWNYPVNLTLLPLASAIASGNTVALKPSEHAPVTAQLLAELLPRYLDSDAVAVVLGDAATAEALIDSGVDHCFVTGGASVGRAVASRAAASLTPVTLELGGKSPAVVAADADLSVAARRIAWGKFLNAGQSCIAPDYVLVEASSRDGLVAALRATIKEFYGEDPMRSPDFGRIATDAHARRLAGLLVGHGGSVVAGGDVELGARYVAPTVVVDPAPSSALMAEEIFGPILPVVSVEDLAAAAHFVASRPAPLALYLFGQDDEALERVAARTRSGSIVRNATMLQFVSSALPFGGVGASGIGQYHGRFGFETFSQRRAAFAKPIRPDLRFAYPPYRRIPVRLSRRLLRLLLDLGRPLRD